MRSLRSPQSTPTNIADLQLIDFILSPNSVISKELYNIIASAPATKYCLMNLSSNNWKYSPVKLGRVANRTPIMLKTIAKIDKVRGLGVTLKDVVRLIICSTVRGFSSFSCCSLQPSFTSKPSEYEAIDANLRVAFITYTRS